MTNWGASPNDVWIGSAGGFDKLWYYDGANWAPYPYREGPSGFSGDFYSIFGFAKDDVWMGGGDGEIFHYNGERWELFYRFEKQGYNITLVSDIWGTATSDIYAVGNAIENETSSYKGFLLHYDGEKWEELLVTDFGAQFQRVRKGKEGLIIRGSHRADGEPSTLSFFKYSDHQFKTLLSETAGEVETLWMNNVGEDIYYIVGNELKQRRNRAFKTFLSTTENSTPIGINGRHEKDLFIVTENGVTHYNGQDYYTLVNLENEVSYVFRELVFERDIFFLVNDYGAGTNLIYHGTLTEEEQGE
ncbi:hypothetical protein [Gracilimonas mengyeensis]|uniref:Uncharacterized protein n=1 Tax=Gracilimonas mengyeensis TaxID=1302730 RepID=A0A521CRA8_9BACT|nr:hypothetical protein [Gracilimonas mengyeensis]SMO61997.1 hypothetical protein SAMN06265219_10697 [Gracilimonas mengyeensis]